MVMCSERSVGGGGVSVPSSRVWNRAAVQAKTQQMGPWTL